MNEKKTTIMLVEDDEKLAAATKEYLELNDFEVSIEYRGDLAVERILKENPDFVILDYMLPYKDAKTICKEVRPFFNNPIIVVTAHEDDYDENSTLDMGADEYLIKPINPRNLRIRIKNLLERYERIAAEAIANSNVSHASTEEALQIDVKKEEAIVDGHHIKLTSKEFALLKYFFENQGVVLTREEIYKQVVAQEWDGIDRSIDLRVSRLRSKLDDNGKSPRFIKSIRGTGYMLVSQE